LRINPNPNVIKSAEGEITREPKKTIISRRTKTTLNLYFFSKSQNTFIYQTITPSVTNNNSAHIIITTETVTTTKNTTHATHTHRTKTEKRR
jgi:hypothetical protein